MSTNFDDIKIDLDEIDRELAKAKEKKRKAEPAEPVIAEAEAPAPEKKIIKPEEGLETLRKQLESEKTAREEAERRAAAAQEAELKARTESQDTNLHLVSTAIEKIEQQNVILKANLKQAFADQDSDAISEIQYSMAENAANLVQLKQGKTALEKQPKPVARAPDDPVESFAAQLSPRAAQWIRSHPDFVTDRKKNAKMIAAHEFIKGDVELDSDKYFERIEEMLGISSPAAEINVDEEDPMADAAKPVKKAAPAAAPVTRSGNGPGPRQNVVTLTADQREVARLNGQTDEEYARHLVALRKEGRLN